MTTPEAPPSGHVPVYAECGTATCSCGIPLSWDAAPAAWVARAHEVHLAVVAAMGGS